MHWFNLVGLRRNSPINEICGHLLGCNLCKRTLFNGIVNRNKIKKQIVCGWVMGSLGVGLSQHIGKVYFLEIFSS